MVSIYTEIWEDGRTGGQASRRGGGHAPPPEMVHVSVKEPDPVLYASMMKYTIIA